MPEPCHSCDHWVRVPPAEPFGEAEGECHGGLPQLPGLPAQRLEVGSRHPLAGVWPVTLASQGCACHSALKPAPAPAASRRRGKGGPA